jgi:hypothetical protein
MNSLKSGRPSNTGLQRSLRGVDNGTRGDSPKYVASLLGAPQEQGLDGDGEAMRLPDGAEEDGHGSAVGHETRGQ